jgi:hypothetical protein
MITQLRHDLKAEVMISLNFRKYEIQSSNFWTYTTLPCRLPPTVATLRNLMEVANRPHTHNGSSLQVRTATRILS